jgi:hypothetical protein
MQWQNLTFKSLLGAVAAVLTFQDFSTILKHLAEGPISHMVKAKVHLCKDKMSATSLYQAYIRGVRVHNLR